MEQLPGDISELPGHYARSKAMAEPVLVASTDGVGTKVKLAAMAGSYASIGMAMTSARGITMVRNNFV